MPQSGDNSVWVLQVQVLSSGGRRFNPGSHLKEEHKDSLKFLAFSVHIIYELMFILVFI